MQTPKRKVLKISEKNKKSIESKKEIREIVENKK
jgi:hypothetical protein